MEFQNGARKFRKYHWAFALAEVMANAATDAVTEANENEFAIVRV